MDEEELIGGLRLRCRTRRHVRPRPNRKPLVQRPHNQRLHRVRQRRFSGFLGPSLRRYIGKHIPGNPIVIAASKPGVGSCKFANWLTSVAPKDGTAFGIVSPTIALEEAMGSEGVQYKAAQFNRIGPVTQRDRGHDALPHVAGEDDRRRDGAPGSGRARPRRAIPSCSMPRWHQIPDHHQLSGLAAGLKPVGTIALPGEKLEASGAAFVDEAAGRLHVADKDVEAIAILTACTETFLSRVPGFVGVTNSADTTVPTADLRHGTVVSARGSTRQVPPQFLDLQPFSRGRAELMP